ncbi:MAG: hypothetical protein ACRDT4_26795, partial [Micromonosporaceae bacterium]
RFEDTRVVRLATAAGAGLLAAGVAGSALYASGYGTAAPIGVAVAALLGGLISGVPARVLAAGVAGALTVAVVHFVTALFTSSLRGLLDGAGTGREMAGANSLLGMLISLLAGVAAGVVSYLVLRRHRPVGLVGHLAAGAAAGVFLLVAEVVSRLTLMSVIRESGGMVWDEVWLLQRIAEARLSGGLLILFAGAIAGLIALGRAKPRTPAKQFKPRQPPASGGTTEAGTKPAAKAKPAAKGGTEPAAD